MFLHIDIIMWNRVNTIIFTEFFKQSVYFFSFCIISVAPQNNRCDHSAKRFMRPPFFFHPLLLDMQPPPCPHSWHRSQENTRFCDDTLESGRLKTSNIKPWKPITYRNCVLSTECVLIDIIVKISIAVCTGCNFPQGEVGTKSHHIKIYHNRLTIS